MPNCIKETKSFFPFYYLTDKYFLRIFKKSNELEMKNSLHFDIDEFCGLEVGCTLEKSRWFKNIRNRTFLRLLFTEGRTLEFIVENEKDQPLIAFRAIETWRKKLSRELGYSKSASSLEHFVYSFNASYSVSQGWLFRVRSLNTGKGGLQNGNIL